MIYSLTGRIVSRQNSLAVIECAGVGYGCQTTNSTLSKIGNDTVTLLTYMHITENSLDLFGFATRDELELFKMLISVSGVGPKVALAILSDIPPAKFNLYVVSGDVKAITKAQGVGPKLAQRIVLELKDKVDLNESSAVDLPAGIAAPGGTAQGEAISALVALGYTQAEAATAVARLDPTLSVEGMIRGALKQMM